MGDSGEHELGKHWLVTNLNEYEQWAFPAGHLLVMSSLLRKASHSPGKF